MVEKEGERKRRAMKKRVRVRKNRIVGFRDRGIFIVYIVIAIVMGDFGGLSCLRRNWKKKKKKKG